MSLFTSYAAETAPEESRELVKQSVDTYSFLPNLHAILAEAPAAYKAYLDTFALFENNTTFSPLEQQIVFQTANYENNCHYCVPGHTMLMTLGKMPQDIIGALREGQPLSDPKLEALRVYVRRVQQKAGHLSTEEIQEFLDAGYTQRQALEVLVGLASKLISNFTNALARTEIDEPVKAFAWTHTDKRNQGA